MVRVLGVEQLDGSFPRKVTYHPSCHGARLLGIREEPLTLLRAIQDLELVPLPKADDCCGFGGTFAIKLAPISAAIVDEKVAHITETNAHYVVGTDLGCLMNITGRMKVKGIPVQGVHMAELVDRALREGFGRRPMSLEPTSALDSRTSVALRDDFLRSAVRFTVDKLRGSKAVSTEALGSWEDWRERGRAIRAHTIDNLDHYLERFCANASARGAHVHFATDAKEARAMVVDVVKQRQARRVVKSKSMLSEEIGINEVLEKAGIDVVETDLGEWIVQLAHETPSHLILPAIHKQRSGIQKLFEEENGEKLSPETKVLAGYARRRIRQKFQEAEVGITGCNFAIAETGSVVLFTNEGNGRMVTTLPDTHIVLMGMERIVPTWSDLEVMANLLPRSATGQKLTTYLNIISGPKRTARRGRSQRGSHHHRGQWPLQAAR